MIVPPAQVVMELGTGATTTPLVVFPGRISVRETISSGLVILFVSVMVSVDNPFALTVGGSKVFAIVRDVTVSAAVMLPVRVLPSLLVTCAGVIVLVNIPGVLLVT